MQANETTKPRSRIAANILKASSAGILINSTAAIKDIPDEVERKAQEGIWRREIV